jgi:muconolactone delta-isomerase
MKDSASDIPPATYTKLLEATANWVYRYKSAGILSEIHMMAGRNRIVTICNHESTEDLTRVLSTLPLGKYIDIEVYPLADINESINALIENAKKKE